MIFPDLAPPKIAIAGSDFLLMSGSLPIGKFLKASKILTSGNSG
jgi:hypothetical protein